MAVIRIKQKHGFTIVELLISLAILALLMAAMATAIYASSVNYKTNKALYDSINVARQGLFRMTTDIRGAIITTGESDSLCSMITADSRDITYRYDSDSQTLYMDVNSGANAGTYTLCENITAMSFTKTTIGSPAIVRSVRISMTISTDGVTQKLAAGAVARRSL